MRLALADWLVLAAYFAVSFGIAWHLRARAQRSLADFFVSGRSVPWWIAGTSMVATTFAVDTPLAVTGLTAQFGIAGNWFWWSMLLSGMLTVFFFARLWRRAGVLTDVELIELRYAGRPAAFLRGFRALYLGVLMNCLIIGWVNLAMAKILEVSLGLRRIEAVLVCLALTAAYTTLSGLWGVLITDLLQFVLMMTMTIVLAYFAVAAVGGLGGLKSQILAAEAARGGEGSLLNFLPTPESAWMPLTVFLVYIGINWWASWYPGAEPGGGGYVAQRIFCAKDEKHSLWATLWFNIAHYALRPWPWILVALVSVVLYPELADRETGYVRVMVDHLPASLRGLMLAAFLAAYMSTVSTHLNWGASYAINDLYRRFLRPQASERHHLRASQVATLLLMLIAAGVTYFLETIREAWQLLLTIGAGTGTVYLLRWYWWRINAWSEISAMVAAFSVSFTLYLSKPFGDPKVVGEQIVFAKNMVTTTVIVTAVWLAVTYLTRPEPAAHLVSFYRRVRPAARGWRPIAARAPDVPAVSSGWYNLRAWVLGCALVYLALFSVGTFLLGSWTSGSLLAAGAATAGLLLYWHFTRRGWESFG
ncbi:MAG: sodium:solute symporter family protein [Candidatus Acidoferrales bacterium]